MYVARVHLYGSSSVVRILVSIIAFLLFLQFKHVQGELQSDSKHALQVSHVWSRAVWKGLVAVCMLVHPL